MRQTHKARRARPGSRVSAIIILTLTAVAASNASAEVWRFTPRLTVEQAYNDNIDLEPKGQEQSDFVTSISPGLSVRGTGRKLSLNFDYDPEQVFFWKDSSESDLRQRFRGFANAELIEQLLFFEASGSVNQQFTDNTGAIGGTTLTTSDNLETVQTYSAGPILRNHFGTFADTELRYTYSAFLIGGDDVADTTQNEVGFLARSGRDFTRVAWTLTANASEAERDGGTGTFSGTDTERQLARFDTQYAINSSFSLLAGVGYEKIEDPTLTDPPDDPIWDVGFLFRPNSLSTMRFTAGERFGGANYNAAVDYQYSPLTRFRASYVQAINTSQGLGVQGLSTLGLGQSGTLINTQTGQPFLPGDPRFGVSSAAFRQDRFSAGVEHTSLRNRYSLNVFDEKREFDTTINDNTHSRGIILGFNRSMTPLISLNLGASYSRSEFENQSDREDDFLSGSAGLSYQLSDTAQARFTYRHTERTSSAPNSDIIENFVAVTLLKEF